MTLPQASTGAIETAIRGHYPTKAVLFEASALDRELAYEPPCWEALLQSIESFTTQYPAVLLQSPNALEQLGNACLRGVGSAPGLALKVKSANLLVDMLRGVICEQIREGPDRIQQSIPVVTGRLLGCLLDYSSWMTSLISLSDSQLVPTLLLLGKQILLAMTEGTFKGEWGLLISTLDRLLIKLIQLRVEGEPFYEGEWDQGEISGQLAVALLEPVRKNYIQKDLDWLRDTEYQLEKGKLSEVDTFLELAAYTNREEREQAWEAWFGLLAATGSSGHLPIDTLRTLFDAIEKWISTIRDRRFLSKLAANLRNTVAVLAKAGREPGLEYALGTIGLAITTHLEMESGRGDIDSTSARLRFVVASLVESYLEQTEKQPDKELVELCLRNRTGPLAGRPLSRDDVVWRMTTLIKNRQLAEPLLLSMIAGFSLEELVLQEGVSISTNHISLTQALGELLGRSWPRDVLHLIRTVVRITPVSPLHLGGASTFSHLMALDPEDTHGSYLRDLREKMLCGTGKDNLHLVESVLWFWSTGKPEYLDNLACPESIAALPAEAEQQRTEHIKKMIQCLREHAPVSHVSKQGIEWLGSMPESYYRANTILKVAGSADCSSKALDSLVHLLNIYRDLLVKFHGDKSNFFLDQKSVAELFQGADDLLTARKDLFDKLFVDGGLEGLEPNERLDLFKRDIDLLARFDRMVGHLVFRCRQEEGSSRLVLGAKIMSRIWASAELSGLGSNSFNELIECCIKEPLNPQWIAELHKLTAELRSDLSRKLKPYVLDCILRLQTNLFARPAPAYAELIGSDRFPDNATLCEEILKLLVNDLLSTDGGLLGIEQLITTYNGH